MIAVSDPQFSLEPFEIILKRVSKYFKSWEILAEGEHWLPKIRAQYKKLIPSFDIETTVHAPLSDVNIASLNETIRKESINLILETIKIARELEIKMVTLHPGHLSPLTINSPSIALELTKKALFEIDKVAKDYGVRLALENMPNMSITICRTPEELISLISSTDIKLCFDVGHANTNRQINRFLDYTEYFVNVHLHDNNGAKDYHLALGEGEIDFFDVIKKLRANYNGNYVVECRGIESGVRSKNYLVKLLA